MAMLCAAAFSILPLSSEIALRSFPPLTLCWSRLALAAVISLSILYFRQEMRPWLHSKNFAYLTLAACCLAYNYFGYTTGILLSGPSNAQILVQLAPLGLALIGIFAFRERFTRWQFFGLLIAGISFFLFARERAQTQVDAAGYSRATTYIISAALAWSCFAALQKKISADIPAQLCNGLILSGGAILLTPLISFPSLSDLMSFPGLLLVFTGILTWAAYTTLASALANTTASVVSLVIATNPMFTLVWVYLLNSAGSDLTAIDILSPWGYFYAIMAVVGVTVVVVNRSKGTTTSTPQKSEALMP